MSRPYGEWEKSSYSGTGSQSDCVEVALFPDSIGVRDSKAPESGNLAVSAGSFAAMIRRVKSGELD